LCKRNIVVIQSPCRFRRQQTAIHLQVWSIRPYHVHTWRPVLIVLIVLIARIARIDRIDCPSVDELISRWRHWSTSVCTVSHPHISSMTAMISVSSLYPRCLVGSTYGLQTRSSCSSRRHSRTTGRDLSPFWDPTCRTASQLNCERSRVLRLSPELKGHLFSL